MQLCLEPEFNCGHGALRKGKIDDERFVVLLTETLPQAVDGLQAREWIADHDVIDHALPDKALAGLPAASAVQVGEACARWARLRFAPSRIRGQSWTAPGPQPRAQWRLPLQGPLRRVRDQP